MKISVNLATRPYVELRPFFLRLRLLMALLALVCVGLAVWTHFESAKADHAQEQMDALRYKTLAVQQKKMHAEQRMRTPPNSLVLERAHFLNRLFLAKSFSWTAVMMDLENVLPTGVQVTAIEPQVTSDGDVVIRLKVAGERDRAVQLVRNLEHSKRFLEPRLSGESTQSKENAGGQMMAANPNQPVGTEFDILANYNPLPENEPYTYAKGEAKLKDASASGAGVEKPRKAVTPTVMVGPRGAYPNSMYPKNGVVLKPAPVKGGSR